MNMKIDALAKRLNALIVGPSINATSTYAVDSYSICASPMHSAQNCPTTSVFTKYPMEQANAFNDYRKQSAGPYSEKYNLGWRNHPNFSWKQNQGGAPQNAKTHYPPGFQAQQHNQPTPPSACLFTPISSRRNHEDIHPIEWSADARASEIHYDQQPGHPGGEERDHGEHPSYSKD